MRGLIIWASTNCRSTLALYQEIARQIGVPVKVALYVYKCDGMRADMGFRKDEFSSMEMVHIGKDYNKGVRLISDNPGYSHIFTIFQRAPNYRRLLIEAHRRGEHVAVAAESPCNMFFGVKRCLKELYERLYLPLYARDVVRAADFFVNYSGDALAPGMAIGWRGEQILPFGYFPPPIEGSKVVLRTTAQPFRILATGVLSRYRGVDVLVEALRLLNDRGIPYVATITQTGELLQTVKDTVRRYQLPVEFLGFVTLPKLVELYETCSVYVGSGRAEPWGMRLNDALNCGAPLIVSRGMGGVQLVERYGCGLAFDAGSAEQLADALQEFAQDGHLYRECARNAVSATHKIAPDSKAREFIDMISRFGDAWRRPI